MRLRNLSFGYGFYSGDSVQLCFSTFPASWQFPVSLQAASSVQTPKTRNLTPTLFPRTRRSPILVFTILFLESTLPCGGAVTYTVQFGRPQFAQIESGKIFVAEQPGSSSLAEVVVMPGHLSFAVNDHTLA